MNIPAFDLDQYAITAPQMQAYLAQLDAHIAYVREAGLKLGGIPAAQLQLHDQSKFSIDELPYYVREFFGDKGDPDGFARAWLHHLHYNPHHWQHWVFPDGYTPAGSGLENGIVEMPVVYAREMVADWLAANRAYQGDWDITTWLRGHWSQMRLHTNTRRYLKTVLVEAGKAFGLDMVEYPG